MMTTSNRVDISDFIDTNKIGSLQIRIIVMCLIVATFEGFDLQMMSFVAPVLGKLWSIESAAMGSVLSAGLVGLMIGGLVSGPISDKLGRKVVIAYSAFAFGIFSLLTVLSTDVDHLLIFRLLTGLGLGGAMPNIIALTAEYSPKRLQKTMVTVMFCGVPLGAVVGGILAAKLIPVYGWHSVFYLGGIIPIGLAILFAAACPESIRFLTARNAAPEKIAKILKKMQPLASFPQDSIFYLPERKLKGNPIKNLFTQGFARNTILLWIIFFMNLFITYFVAQWMPTALNNAGFPLSKAIIAVALLYGGGVIGGLIMSWYGDRRSLKGIMGWALVINAAVLVIISIATNANTLLFLIFLAGLLFIGVQFGLNGLAATIYPTDVRASGVSWALGIGRIGSIIGPTLGGLILPLLASPTQMFMIAAIPSIIGAIALVPLKASNYEEKPGIHGDEAPNLKVQ